MLRVVTHEADPWLSAVRHGVVRAVDLVAFGERLQASWRNHEPDALSLRDEFGRIVDGIAAGVTTGSPESVDDAIWFLDADPWCLYSGDAKAKIMRRLVTAPLTNAQRERLSRIVIAAVDAGWRREFRETSSLARRLGGRTLRDGLRRRLHDDDLPAARRAALVLVRLRRPKLSDRDRRRAQVVVMSDLRELAEHDRLFYRPWSVRAAPALVDDAWIAELERQASAAGINREPARALLDELRGDEG